MKIIFKLGLAGLLTVLLLASNVWAKDFDAITAKELKTKMDAGEEIFLLNPLSDIEFNEGHIPGSVNVPLHTLSTTSKLPKNKETLIVTYCLGPK
jgi:rhodanese-related sulfurtransferase